MLKKVKPRMAGGFAAVELVDDAADASIKPYVRWMPDVADGTRKAGQTSHLPACCRLLVYLLDLSPI